MSVTNKNIYSNQINSTELLRSLAYCDSNAFNLRIFNFKDLLDEVNARLGFPINNKVLSNEEIKDKVINYFGDSINKKNLTYQDFEHFMSSLNKVRMYCVESDELTTLSSLFSKNSDARGFELLLKFFKTYLTVLNESSDPAIDMIMYCRSLIEAYKKNPSINFEISYFSHEDLTPLETLFLKTINNGKEPEALDLIDLYHVEQCDNQIKLIKPCYGVANEVNHVMKDIIDHKYKLSDCQIVLINQSGYTNELYKFKKNNNIEMTFECGLPINLVDPYKLYKSLCQLDEKYFFDVNGYMNLFSSESLDLVKLIDVKYKVQVAQLLGRMKISFNKEENDRVYKNFEKALANHKDDVKVILEKFDFSLKNDSVCSEVLKNVKNCIDEFSQGQKYILEKYTKNSISNEEIFSAGLECIAEILDSASSGKIPSSFVDSYLNIIDTKNIYHKVFNDSGVHVCNFAQAFSTVRKHVYILGLNSSVFPGSLTQDFLFGDYLYEQLSGESNLVEKSLQKNNKRLKTFIDDNLKLGNDVYLSYNCQDFNGVRMLNPCSVLLDYAEDFYKEINDNKPQDQKDELTRLSLIASYYDHDLNSLSNIQNMSLNNSTIITRDLKLDPVNGNERKKLIEKCLEKQYGPSTIPSLLQCPLKFYLDNIVHADNTITYDPLRPISGNRFGDLLHRVMEQYILKISSGESIDLITYAENFYDLYSSIDRPVCGADVEKVPFLKSVQNAKDYLDSNFDITSGIPECKIGYSADKDKAVLNGIYFHGSVDLCVKDNNGESVILDYKSGQNIEHKAGDFDSCIQGIIYAQLYKKVYEVNISKVIFYYTRFGKEVIFENPCSEENTNKVNEKINSFKNTLSMFIFEPASAEGDICKYCKYKGCCKTQKSKNENKEETVDGD